MQHFIPSYFLQGRFTQRTTLLIGCLYLLALTTTSYGQNICLDFDGMDDEVSTSIPIVNNDLTIEMWFLDANTTGVPMSCSGNFNSLFNLNGATSWFNFGSCGGELNLEFSEGFNGYANAISPNINYADGAWHHFALTYSNLNVSIYIDCVLEYSVMIHPMGFDFNSFELGYDQGSIVLTGSPWHGRIDDVRIWNYSRSLPQIIAEKECVLAGDEIGLDLYWNFDEGDDNVDNTAIPAVTDLSSPAHNGLFFGFDLLADPVSTPIGGYSNYVGSDAPMLDPYLSRLDLTIKDYPYKTGPLTVICPGDPAHFELDHTGLVGTAPNQSGIPIQWFYDDHDGNGPQSITDPAFSGFVFGVPSGRIDYDCSSSVDGFVDRTYFAETSVNSSTSACPSTVTDNYDLRICCPITPSSVTLSPSGFFCEGESTTFQVGLSSPDPFVMTPGPNVTIDWSFDGVLLPAFQNMTSFTYPWTAPTVGSPQNFCFTAQVSNCGGKTGTFSECVRVDPEPVCGSIVGSPAGNPTNLTLTSTTPHLTYSICPGDDATLEEDANDSFIDCNPQWQYAFSLSGPWIALGFTNSYQNTNILPTSSWGSNTSIYYRAECSPLVIPSGCLPCYSDPIEIQLDQPPATPIVNGAQASCIGGPLSLNVSNPNGSFSYEWFCDGLLIGSGTSISTILDRSACYWVVVGDGCHVVRSVDFCVTACAPNADLSCPLPPNECACLGVPITLDACSSSSNCGPITYQWYIDGLVQPSITGCILTHTPAIGGTVYRVDVIDSQGCIDSKERTIVPCDKNN